MLAVLKRARNYSFSKSNLALILVASIVVLTLIGLVVLASASQSFSNGVSTLFEKQLISLLLAIIGGIVVSRLNLNWFRKYSVLVAVIAITLLVMVLIPFFGVKVNGAQRWLNFGGITFQPSDVAKLGMIFVMSHYIAVNQKLMHEFKEGFVIPGSFVVTVCLLILLEPDFGTAFLCGIVGFGMMFMAGTRLRFLFPSLSLAVGMFAVAVMLSPVRLKRLTAFLDMEANKADGAYQLWQGILAFAAGGIEGVGLGNGRQQMAFLPEAHTDFIFPIIGEELGVFLTVSVVLLFMLFFLAGIGILRRTKDMFYRSLVIGAVLCVTFQALINLCVVTGLMPTKGMSLPFISYGGSNLILVFILVGFMVNCLRQWRDNPFEKERGI